MPSPVPIMVDRGILAFDLPFDVTRYEGGVGSAV
jgi:hypothetical protein